MKSILASIVAGVAILGAIAVGPVVTKSEAATCLDGSKYQSFKVSYASRTTGTLSTANGLPLCKDQPMVFESFNFAKTWDGKNFLTSLPQTMHSYTKFTFPGGKANHKMTVTVKAPDNCLPTQIDFYVGGTPINQIPKSDPTYGEDREVRSGKIFNATEKCEAPVKNIQVCDLATKKVITIKETDFDAKKHSKNLDDCKPVVVKDIQVCELATKKVITIKENEFDAKKHSRNLDDCKPVVVKNIQVCDLDTMEVITIKETDFDSEKHSKNLDDCKEVETPVTPTPVTPEQPKEETPAPVVELPETGDSVTFINVLGASTALGLAVHNLVRRFN